MLSAPARRFRRGSHSSRIRVAGIVAVLTAGAITVPALDAAGATGAPPHPSRHDTAASVGSQIKTVQQRLADLARRSDLLVERYDRVNATYQRMQANAERAESSSRSAQHTLRVAHDDFSAAAAAQYEGGTYSATGALLESSSGQTYLDQLTTMTQLSDHSAQLVSNYTSAKAAADRARSAADAALSEAAAANKQVVAARAATTAQIAKSKTMLASLTEKQREILAAKARREAAAAARRAAEARALAAEQRRRDNQLRYGGNGGLGTGGNTGNGSGSSGSGSNGSGSGNNSSGGSGSHGSHSPSAPSDPGTPPQVQTAIDFALNQVGKPYDWGSAGPNSYDCSGLTMASYAAAGISLPHSSAAQYGYGHHVSFDDLRPGDLMFYYNPIGHVTIYIGHGMMVSAPQTGEDVKVMSIHTSYSSDFTGATRIVG